MLPAILTTICFSFSVVCASRSAKLVGGMEANFWRLALAAVFLAIWAFSWGQGLASPAFPTFFLSGIIGIGFGDIGLFQALTRIGPRLTILLVQCLTAPFAAAIEWWWLGARLSPAEIFWAVVILAGIGVSLAPGEHLHIPRRQFVPGVVFGILGALGGAFGAVLSRKAYQTLGQEGASLDGGTAAFQRLIGGVIIAGIGLLLVKWRSVFDHVTRSSGAATLPEGEKWRRAWPWILANSLAGQTIGVSFYQWAFQTTRTGIVLPIVAMTPLMAMPMTRWLDHERVSRRAILGGIIAVTGAIGLALHK